MMPRANLTSRPVMALCAGLACTLWPARADAHLVTTGLGPIYDGISHVLVSPDDLVPVVAMALLAGMNGPTAGRRTLFALTGAWLAGGAFGVLAGSSSLPGAATAASFLLLGSLAALDRRLSPSFVGALAVSVGLLHGWSNGVGIADEQRDAIGLVGNAAATFVLVALAASFAVRARAPWSRIALRVVGSWVAAIGLLLLGWSLRVGA